MIAVELEGRLGNQLFQYAFAYATAKRLGVKFYMDKTIIPFLVPEYFELPAEPLFVPSQGVTKIKGFKNLFSHHLPAWWYRLLKAAFGLKEERFFNYQSYEVQENKIMNNVFFKGYFQSEKYFETAKEDVVRLFTVKERHKHAFEQVRSILPADQKLVAVHIRRSDYIDIDMALPLSYYHQAVAASVQGSYFIFVSDDPDYVEQEFGYLENKYVSRNSEIVDLQLLMHATHCILSCSSFSWWGAYLNPNHPTVVVPENWMGFQKGIEDPVGIILKNWKKSPITWS